MNSAFPCGEAQWLDAVLQTLTVAGAVLDLRHRSNFEAAHQLPV
jgi:hypothetical protein